MNLNKKILIILSIFIGLSITGCSVTPKKVYYKPIKENSPYRYYFYHHPNGIIGTYRIIGVFKKNKINKNKIKKAIQNVIALYKPYNTLKSQRTKSNYTDKEIMKDCKRKLLIGVLGSVRNIYERNEVLNLCFDDSDLRHKQKITFSTSGSSLAIHGNKLRFNERGYITYVIIKTFERNNFIVVSIKSKYRISDYVVDDLEVLNNQLINQFKAVGLINQKKKINIGDYLSSKNNKH